MKKWWQVYYYDLKQDCAKCFGFSTINEKITDHPDYKWKYKTLEEYKTELKKLPYLQVIQIV